MQQIFSIDTTPVIEAICNREETVKHKVSYKGHPLSPEAQAAVDARLNEVLAVIVRDLMIQLSQGKVNGQRGRDHGEA